MELHSNTDLFLHIKSETIDNTFRNLALSLLEDYFYTDGFNTKAGVGAEYSENTIKMTKLPDFCSIYTAEAYAVS